MILRFSMLKTRKYILPTFQTKKDSKRKKQVIILMIPSGERQDYLVVEKYLYFMVFIVLVVLIRLD